MDLDPLEDPLHVRFLDSMIWLQEEEYTRRMNSHVAGCKRSLTESLKKYILSCFFPKDFTKLRVKKSANVSPRTRVIPVAHEFSISFPSTRADLERRAQNFSKSLGICDASHLASLSASLTAFL